MITISGCLPTIRGIQACAREWPGSDPWYARVSRDIRLFYEVREGSFLLLDIGHHGIEGSR